MNNTSNFNVETPENRIFILIGDIYNILQEIYAKRESTVFLKKSMTLINYLNKSFNSSIQLLELVNWIYSQVIIDSLWPKLNRFLLKENIIKNVNFVDKLPNYKALPWMQETEGLSFEKLKKDIKEIKEIIENNFKNRYVTFNFINCIVSFFIGYDHIDLTKEESELFDKSTENSNSLVIYSELQNTQFFKRHLNAKSFCATGILLNYVMKEYTEIKNKALLNIFPKIIDSINNKDICTILWKIFEIQVLITLEKHKSSQKISKEIFHNKYKIIRIIIIKNLLNSNDISLNNFTEHSRIFPFTFITGFLYPDIKDLNPKDDIINKLNMEILKIFSNKTQEIDLSIINLGRLYNSIKYYESTEIKVKKFKNLSFALKSEIKDEVQIIAIFNYFFSVVIKLFIKDKKGELKNNSSKEPNQNFLVGPKLKFFILSLLSLSLRNFLSSENKFNSNYITLLFYEGYHLSKTKLE